MEISFSQGEIAVIGALLVAVTGALSLVFRLLLAEKDARIARLERQNDLLQEIALNGTQAVKSATTALSNVRGER